MQWLGEFFRRLGMLFRGDRFDRDLEEELHLHFELKKRELIEEGLSPTEAWDAAHRQMGNLLGLRVEGREMWNWEWLNSLRQDLSYGIRALRKNPGFTAIALLTLTLGIGANTALFSVVDAVLLRPLPFPNPGQLVTVNDNLTSANLQNVGMSQPEIDDFQKSSGVFEQISAAWPIDVNVTGGEKPERVEGLGVSFDYFELLGAKPEIGRVITSQDYQPGFTQCAVISDSLWRRMFGKDPKVIGTPVRLDGDLYVIVGVMPPNFRHPGPTLEHDVDTWVAAGFIALPFPVPPSRDIRMLPGAIGRLKPGLTLEQAQAKLNMFVENLRAQYPASYPAAAGWKVRLEPLQKDVVGNTSSMLVILLSAVGLVLLIACVNIAALLLARSSSRYREFAIRRALGAGSGRLIRQALTESVVLSFSGAALGLLLNVGLQGALLRWMPERLPRLAEVKMNEPVLLFTLGLAVLTGLLFGAAPSFQLADPRLITNLKEGTRGSGMGSKQNRLLSTLIVSEVALSLILMVGAGLLLRSFWNLLSVSPGFNPDHVVVAQMWLPQPNDPTLDLYPDTPKQAALSREILRRISALPGVQFAAIGNQASLPLSRQSGRAPFEIEGRPVSNAETPTAITASVTPEYFHLFQTPLIAGRFFTDSDIKGGEGVVLVDEVAAQRYWPNESPVGKRIRLLAARFQRGVSEPRPVVGVVGRMKSASLDEPFAPHIYASIWQSGGKIMSIFVRSTSSSEMLAEPLRREVQAIDPTLPVFNVRTMDSVVSDSLAARRFAMTLLGFFAATAMILASIGIYGVMAYFVTQRAREIGIRIALGASRRDVLRLIVGRGVWLTLTGVGVGIVGAALLTRSLQSMIFNVKPLDPLTLFAGAALLVVVALAACFIPTLRAMRVDPVLVLRSE